MLAKYGILGSFKMLISLVYTKLFFRKARIIRLPIDIRNRRYISIGQNLTTGIGCRLEAYPKNGKPVLHMGKDIQMNDYVHITAIEHVSIGNNVLIASKVYISDCSHGSYKGDELDSDPGISPIERPLFSKKVIIEDNVWIGEFVSILPGVTIGRGTIIGSNSVVTKNLPENVIAVGSPAKPIKKYNFETQHWENIDLKR